MTRYATKTDVNHKPMVMAFRRGGLIAVDTSSFGDGFPDILVVDPDTGRVGMVEAKTFENMRAGKIRKEVKFMLSLVSPAYRMFEDPEKAVNVMREMLR